MGKSKKKVIEPIQRVKVVCPEYKGYLDEMPEEIKAIREARKDAKLFEKKEVI